jgi:hypothetical protein
MFKSISHNIGEMKICKGHTSIPEAVADLFIKAEGLSKGKLKLRMYRSYLTISLTLLLIKLKLELEPHLDGDEVFSSQK